MPPKVNSIRHMGENKKGSTSDPHHAAPIKGKTSGDPKDLRRPGQG
jgi:hypothetical protein